MKLTIFAATGGTGRKVLEQAVAAGHDVTAVVRNPKKLSGQVRAVAADLTAPDQAALEAAVEGADAVLSGLGPRTNAEAGIASRGTQAIVDAMKATDARRLIVISSESMVTIPSPGRPNPPRHDPGEGFILRYVVGPPARRIILRKQYADLGLMEDVVRDSGLDWTIARPALLTNKPLTGIYRMANGQKPRGGFKISRADVAHFMLSVIERPETFGQAITIVY
ncbi:MAG: NAD(P)-dependent oxidoreductase [Carbonactinosporaceae bacterium]